MNIQSSPLRSGVFIWKHFHSYSYLDGLGLNCKKLPQSLILVANFQIRQSKEKACYKNMEYANLITL